MRTTLALVVLLAACSSEPRATPVEPTDAGRDLMANKDADLADLVQDPKDAATDAQGDTSVDMGAGHANIPQVLVVDAAGATAPVVVRAPSRNAGTMLSPAWELVLIRAMNSVHLEVNLPFELSSGEIACDGMEHKTYADSGCSQPVALGSTQWSCIDGVLHVPATQMTNAVYWERNSSGSCQEVSPRGLWSIEPAPDSFQRLPGVAPFRIEIR